MNKNVHVSLYFNKLDKSGQEFVKKCFISKDNFQCEQMYDYYKYSDSELANIYVAGNVTKEFFMNIDSEMKQKLPERIKHRLDFEIAKTLSTF